MKNKNHILSSSLLYAFFLVYLLLLLNVLILSRISFSEEQLIIRSINIVPLHSIWNYMSGNINVSRSIAFTNIFWNILMFAPLGLYFPVLRGNKKIRSYIVWIFLFSLTVELSQLILGIGASDIDDIILNCLGGLLGLIAYKILLVLFRKEHRVKLFTTIISVAVGAPVLYIAVSTHLYNR